MRANRNKIIIQKYLITSLFAISFLLCCSPSLYCSTDDAGWDDIGISSNDNNESSSETDNDDRYRRSPERGIRLSGEDNFGKPPPGKGSIRSDVKPQSQDESDIFGQSDSVQSEGDLNIEVGLTTPGEEIEEETTVPVLDEQRVSELPQETENTPQIGQSSPSENTEVTEDTTLPIKHVDTTPENSDQSETEVRAKLEALFQQGVSEFTNKKIQESINTFNRVIRNAGIGISKFPASSNYYSDYIQRSNDFIAKAQRSLGILRKYYQALSEYRNRNYDSCISYVDSFLRHDLQSIGLESFISKANDLKQKAVSAKGDSGVLGLLRQAQSDFQSFDYDNCISNVDSFLRHDLENTGLSKYISRATRLRQAALDNKRKKHQIIEKCISAKTAIDSLNLKEAYSLYSSVLALAPEKVGLSDYKAKIEEMMGKIKQTAQLQKAVRGKIQQARNLCRNKDFEIAKSILQQQLAKIDSASFPGYLNRERTMINNLLAKINQALAENIQEGSATQPDISAEEIGTEVSPPLDEVLKNNIISLCRQAKDNYGAFKFERALELYKTVLNMKPESVGLEQIVPKIKQRIGLLENAVALKKNIRAKIKEVVSLCKSKNYEAGKAILLTQRNRITQSPYPTYFAKEIGLINRLLAKIEEKLSQVASQSVAETSRTSPEQSLIPLEFSVTVSKPINIKPGTVEPGKFIAVTFDLIVAGLKHLERVKADITGTAPESISGTEGLSLNLTNGVNPVLFVAHFPKEIGNPGAKQFVVNVSCPEKKYSCSGSGIFVITANESAELQQELLEEVSAPIVEAEHEDDESLIGLPADDSEIKPAEETESIETEEERSPETSTANHNAKPPVMAMIRQVEANYREIWPGDHLAITVPVSVFGLTGNQPVNFDVTASFLGDDQFRTVPVYKNNSDPAVTFNFPVPNDLTKGEKPISVKLEWPEGYDDFTVNIYAHRPIVKILKTYASPPRTKKGGSVKLYGDYIAEDIRPGETVNVHASFSGDIHIGGEEWALKNGEKGILTAGFDFESGEGTINYTFNIQSKYGSSSMPGSFIVGRSTEELDAEESRAAQQMAAERNRELQQNLIGIIDNQNNQNNQNRNSNGNGNGNDGNLRDFLNDMLTDIEPPNLTRPTFRERK